jgi:hypothetical protein
MQLVKYLAITERVLNLLCVLLATSWVPGCPLTTAAPVVHGAGLNTAHLQLPLEPQRSQRVDVGAGLEKPEIFCFSGP